MKTLLTEDWVQIPKDVTVTVKARVVAVTGPRGCVTKNFSHLSCEIQRTKKGDHKSEAGNYLRIRMWFGGRKEACAVNTLKSHISNMCQGVTEGFMYKMRCVNAHFPINCSVPKDGSSIDVKNFLGGKQIKHIDMIPGVVCSISAETKDELIFQGFDNYAVSLCCARVCQSVNVGNKDERKFLDGIFVSQKTLIQKNED